MSPEKSILDAIVLNKQEEVERLPDYQFLYGTAKVVNSAVWTKGFAQFIKLADGPAIIAEIKKASPSKGLLIKNEEDFNPVKIAEEYRTGGAHALSILTDEKFFQGNLKHLQAVANNSNLACLRKDFVIDAKQIAESRIIGADAVLLIAAILSDSQLTEFHDIAVNLGMDVMIEVHNEQEMERALKVKSELIGINNRDLNTFEVSLNTTIELVEQYKKDLAGKIVVSESGIKTNKDVKDLHKLGVKAFLVGELLMTQDDRKAAVAKLLH